MLRLWFLSQSFFSPPRSDYLPYDITYRPLRVQEEYRPIAGEIDMVTTYRRDFNPHKIEPIILVRPAEKKYVSKCKLNAIPTYQGNSANYFYKWEKKKIAKDDG